MPLILYTVGHSLSPSSLSNNIKYNKLVGTKVLRTPIQSFSCLSLVIDGSDCVFHSEMLGSFRLCCRMTGLLPEHDGVRRFPAGSRSPLGTDWIPLGSILEKEQSTWGTGHQRSPWISFVIPQRLLYGELSL